MWRKEPLCQKCPEVSSRKKKIVHHVDIDDTQNSLEGEYVNAVTSLTKTRNEVSHTNKEMKCLMLVVEEEVTFQIGTGLSVNTLPAGYAKNTKPTNKFLITWSTSTFRVMQK